MNYRERFLQWLYWQQIAGEKPTLKEIADRAGVHWATVQRLASGTQTSFRTETLQKIGIAIGRGPDFFLREDNRVRIQRAKPKRARPKNRSGARKRKGPVVIQAPPKELPPVPQSAETKSHRIADLLREVLREDFGTADFTLQFDTPDGGSNIITSRGGRIKVLTMPPSSDEDR